MNKLNSILVKKSPKNLVNDVVTELKEVEFDDDVVVTVVVNKKSK